VRRRVQGVELYLPWSHRLPDYARSCPTYGQNLVDLAVELSSQQPGVPLQVLDVGANVGDSALQILARTPARVLCVEGDPFWGRFLRRNVEGVEAVTIVECFLTDSAFSWSGASPVRTDGTTTHFVPDVSTTVEALTVEELRRRHPEFSEVRLIKSDTDGMDVALVPALIDAWRDTRPVTFFEFDPRLARAAGFTDPDQLWPRLADLGYRRAAVWDNGGRPLGQFDVADGAKHSKVLAESPRRLGYHFWDVAVRHGDDAAAASALDRLVPQDFSA
jgi:FkbM family methyltransferase